ncbi:MAG: hypothetical protein LBS15_00660, partial [Endomicrobium sp.]|nr:hypothetical protein [Endomicrobium sp.]
MKLHNLKKIVGNLTAITVIFLTTQYVTDKNLFCSGEKWFPKNDFKAKEFKQPAPEFAPFVRWWWPGNDVDTIELKREINAFADNGFGGVEIQPISLSVPMGEKTVKEKVLSWDSPSYYTNLKVVLDEAIKRNIIVDMTNGSGWPVGGPYLDIEDGFLTLDFKDKDIKGGEILALKVPEVRNRTGSPSKLIAV